MCMLEFSSLIAIVPISVLLTISFFVLFTLRRVEEKGLKAFGYVVTGFLWLAALIIFLGAFYNMGRVPGRMKYMMHQRMKMESMPQMMQQGNMPGMVMPGKGALPKEQKRPISKYGGNKGVIFKAQ